MESLTATINGFQPLTMITKLSILDFSGVLGMSLLSEVIMLEFKANKVVAIKPSAFQRRT